MADAQAPVNEKAAAFFWPAFIILLLAIPVAAATVLIRAAGDESQFAVEENYYERAINWDQELDQRAANERLGWSVELAAGRGGAGKLFLTARLQDRDEQPVAAESVRVEAFAVAHAADRRRIDLRPADDGSWESATELRNGGLWEFRFTVKAGDETFTQVLRRDVGGAKAPR